MSFLILGVQSMSDIRDIVVVETQKDEQAQDRTVILLDVSKSMNIRDMEGNQSRLHYSKKLIQSYVEQTQNLIGLTIFAGEGVNILPINDQKKLFIDTLQGLDYRHVRLQGSRINDGIAQAYSLFGDEYGGNLIIFTDQDSYEGYGYKDDIQALGTLLKNKNINVTLVGVASESGGNIEIGRDIFGEILYKTYQGQTVNAPLERDFLKEISQQLGGVYLDGEEFFLELDTIDIPRESISLSLSTLPYIILSLTLFMGCLGVLFGYTRKHKATIISNS
ncbi:VWA domain-containing protein [Candidatus Gracilibacteria bacterium]|nr:VWA domain-containing protein [Candidatus Gracilibacteria bacterium]